MKRAFLILAIVVLSLLHWNRGPEPKRLRLILVIAVDQMRYDYLERFKDLYRGGLARLLRGGAIFTNAFYAHANTETGPGHVTILTGKHGSHSGVIANKWYDSFLKKDVNVVDDPLQIPVGGAGRAASPANLIGFTVGDVLKQKHPGTRVIAVSLKDRSAVLMGGKLADAAYWYDSETGHFVTSSYYAKQLPEWLKKWNAKSFMESFAGGKWERLKDDPQLYEKYSGRDDVKGESDGKDLTFPHLFPPTGGSPEFYHKFRGFPHADEMTLEVTVEALRASRLGRGESVDLLAIGFSATDVVGHIYGPDSQEVMDQLLRLDLLLENLFQEIDSRVGLSQTLVVLTSDHGIMPLVETSAEKGLDARRVAPHELEKVVKDALVARFPGAGPFVAAVHTDAPPGVYFDEERLVRYKIRREDAEEAVKNALLATGYVEAVFTHRDFAAGSRPDDKLFQLYRNSFFAPRSPHVILALKSNVYTEGYRGGTGHGTHHDYNRHIPIIFMGPGIKPGAYSTPCGPHDIAPTLASILKLQFPREWDSRILSEMFPQAEKK